MFHIHPRLEQDTFAVRDLALSRLLLMNDARYPWLILVPAKAGLTELHDLDRGDRARLMEEIAEVSQVLHRLYAPDKINVGALGNVVAQLHIHVVARRAGDAAWPGPVWGHGDAEPYGQEDVQAVTDRLLAALPDARP